MSMRLFSRGEFVKELKKFGFIETQQKTANAFIVSYKGQPFVVPLMESYPDYYVVIICMRVSFKVMRFFSSTTFGKAKYLKDICFRMVEGSD